MWFRCPKSIDLLVQWYCMSYLLHSICSLPFYFYIAVILYIDICMWVRLNCGTTCPTLPLESIVRTAVTVLLYCFTVIYYYFIAVVIIIPILSINNCIHIIIIIISIIIGIIVITINNIVSIIVIAIAIVVSIIPGRPNVINILLIAVVIVFIYSYLYLYCFCYLQ